MYQVLYRKYRPQTFEDVVGQEHVTTTLKNEIKNNRINHAYLFTGSRGTGKTTCAKILAKAVNCLDPRDSNPCNECEICKGIDGDEILDVVEMDAASNRKIDNIRDIIEEVAFTPAKARYRVYIVDEVHMLTTEAFNALLKTLEEPPEHVVFILATTEAHKVPSTILSRCQRFDFKRISPEDISKRLIYIAEKENISLTSEAALLISALADGALRDAISILDRCIGISGDVDVDVVRSAAGLASKSHLFEICNCMINKNPAKALNVIDELYQNSKDMSKLTDELISHFRILMLIKTVKDPRKMIALSDREYDAAQSQADRLTLADIVYYMDVLQRAYERMGKGVSNRIELETAVVKLTSAELESTNEALVVRISALEKMVNRIQSGAVQYVSEKKAQSVSGNVKETYTAEKADDDIDLNDTDDGGENPFYEDGEKETPPVQIGKNETVEQQISAPLEPAPEIGEQKAEQVISNRVEKVDVEELSNNAQPFLKWPEVVDNLKKYSQAIAAGFKDCDAYVNGEFLLIDAKSSIPFQLLEKKEQRNNIRDAVAEVTGVRYRLGPYRPSTKNTEKKKDEILDDFVKTLRDKGVSVSEVNNES